VYAGGNLAAERRRTDQHQTLDLPGIAGIGVDRGAFGALAAAAVTHEHDLAQVDAAQEPSSPRLATDRRPLRPEREVVPDQL